MPLMLLKRSRCFGGHPPWAGGAPQGRLIPIHRLGRPSLSSMHAVE
ncbi:hypothetical protein MPS_2949 [Mycobacterium pseudoshottsii JCM 15466]|nr:hypothetical protein MPS_2949 [Mycobacterium pseudoshottsii JCM 15466]